MDAQKANPDRGETSQMRHARYGIDLSLADIKRLHEELQNQEIQSRRPAWQPFALGFAIGSVFFAAANGCLVPRMNVTEVSTALRIVLQLEGVKVQ